MKKIWIVIFVMSMPIISLAQKTKKDTTVVYSDTIDYFYRTIVDIHATIQEIKTEIKMLPNQDDIMQLQLRIQELRERQDAMETKINDNAGPGNPGVDMGTITNLQDQASEMNVSINNLVEDIRQIDIKIKDLESLKSQLELIQKKILELEKK